MLKYINVLLLVVFLALVGVLINQIQTQPPAPISASSLYDRGISYACEGKFADSRRVFEEALALDPYYSPAEGSLKIIEGVEQNKIEPAAAEYLFKGIRLGNQYKPEEKIAAINKALKINPDLPLAYNERGTAYFHLEKYDLAIQDREKCLQLDPENPDPYYNIAIAHEYLGNLEKAHTAYRHYVRLAAPHNKYHIDFALERMRLIVMELKSGNQII